MGWGGGGGVGIKYKLFFKSARVGRSYGTLPSALQCFNMNPAATYFRIKKKCRMVKNLISILSKLLSN